MGWLVPIKGRLALCSSLLLALSCAGDDAGARERLSDWGLFEDALQQVPAEGVVPYALISPLFSDYAVKDRFIQIPPGERITFSAEGVWQFPEGTVLVKTFSFPEDRRMGVRASRPVETRLLVREEGVWVPYVYLYGEDGDAMLQPTGARVEVSWIHDDGETRNITYRVPNVVQCVNCHGGSSDIEPLGPSTQQLDREFDYADGSENQLDRLARLELFDVAVPETRRAFSAPDSDGDLDARARAYLDANCAHCHREDGSAQQSGLWLSAHLDDMNLLGVCKRPVAAGSGAGGRRFDIVPGAPDESVMVFRMESEEPGVKMPELPTVLSHPEGVALIREWIAAMPGSCAE